MTKVAFTPQKKIASCSEDGTLKIWKFGDAVPEVDFRKDKENQFHNEGTILDMSFHQTKSVVVSIGEDNRWVLSQCEKGVVLGGSLAFDELQSVEIGSIFDSFSVASLHGALRTFDMNKMLSLGEYHHENGLIRTKFWESRRMYTTSTVAGELIFNGQGMNKGFKVQEVLKNDYIHDFDFIDDNLICLGAEDSFLYIYDIRKGIFKEHN